MKISTRLAVLLLCTFFIVVFVVAFSQSRYYSLLVLSGEDSVGTWMSGALLIFMASMCFFKSIQTQWNPWIFFAVFFLLLALDEHYMFHEKLKEHIIFSSVANSSSRWIYELPVIVGACIGVFFALIFWRHLTKGRLLLPLVVILGATSVILDVLAINVLWEDSLKLIAELLMASVLLISLDVG